ncbi:MAG: ATP-binding cassette domain-containing protein, partial [Granulosicoccus sp.]|nr:ATP-binding cassette domain-containing protein [Granulosicoccus sp.]
MENGLFSYIFKYSKKEQINLILLTLLAFPFYYFSLNLPKIIINDAINGSNFPINTSLGIGNFSIPFGQFEQVPYLIILCFLFLFLVIVNSGIKLVINIYRGVMGERMLRRIRLALIERIMKFPLLRFRDTSQGELVSMVSQETEPLGGFIGDAISIPFYQGGLLLTVLLFMFVQDWKLGLAAIALYPLQIWFIPRLQKQVNLLNQQRTFRVRKLAEYLGEVVSGISEVHVNGNKPFFTDHFSKLLGRIFNIRVQIFKKKFFIKFLNSAIAQLTPFLFFLIGGLLVIKGDMSVGSLVAAIAAYKDLSPSWKELLTWYQRQADARLKFDILTERFRVDDTATSSNEISPQQWKETLANSPISANGISLKRHDGVRELNNLTLTIAPGEWISVVGTGNSGRNGLAHLLARLVDPSNGKLLMGGSDVTTTDDAITGRAISYVGHDSYIFSATILDNILLSLKHSPTDNKINNHVPDETLEFNGWQKEARLSGNSDIDQDTDWIDYSIFNSSGNSQLLDKIGDILHTVKLNDELVHYALNRSIDASTHKQITDRIVEARSLFKQRLSENGLESLIEFLDREKYNENASIAENILFGVSNHGEFSVDELAEHPVLRELLEELELTEHFDNAAIATATTMVELFSEFPEGHEFFERFSFIESDDLVSLKRIIELLSTNSAIDELNAVDRKLIRSLPYKLISGRHRIGSLNQISQESILELRHKFIERLDQNALSQIEFFSSDRYISNAPIIDNLIYGRIVYGRLGAEEKIYNLLLDVLQEFDMMSPIMEVGLSASTGLGGSLLSVAQQQKILLARGLIKHPSMIVINEGLNSLDTDEIDIILGNIKRDYPGIRLIWIDNKSRYTNFFKRSIHLQAGKIIKIEESESEDINDDSMNSRSSSTPNDQSKLVDSNEKLSLLNGIPLFRFLDTPNLLLLSENCDTLT